MRTIIVINDNSDEALHAAEVALTVAQKNKANLLLANFVKTAKPNQVKVSVTHDYDIKNDLAEEQETNLAQYLVSITATNTGFVPVISNLDVSELQTHELVDFINRNNTWMMVQGCGEANVAPMQSFNCYSLLNAVKCPILFIPKTFKAVDFEQIVYMTDLRYCQLSVARFLTNFAKKFDANLLLAHLSASGLPHIQQEYAGELFNETVGRYLSYDKLRFNNIKETSLDKALDVLIHGMNTELLVLVNHQFHFKEVLEKSLSQNQLPQIGIPLMLFPF